MEQIKLKFLSADTEDCSSLSVELYDNPVVERWKNLVRKAQTLGITYKTRDNLYGGDESLVPDALEDLNRTIHDLSKVFVQTWSDEEFDPIRDRVLTRKQEDLNRAHVFFENILKSQSPGEKALLHSDPSLLEIVGHLNYIIHYLESLSSANAGFFYDFSLGPPYLKVPLKETDTALFTANRLWGEVYLGYPHVGENPLEAFTKNYHIRPTPQTHIGGNFILNFMPDYTFDRQEELSLWLASFYPFEKELKKIPIGLIPIGMVQKDFSPQKAFHLRSNYPRFYPEVEFVKGIE